MTQEELKQYSGKVFENSFLSPYPIGFYTKDELFNEIENYDQFDDWLEYEEEDDDLTFEERFNKYCGAYQPIGIFGHGELDAVAKRLDNEDIVEYVFDSGNPSDEEFIVALGKKDKAIYVWTHDGDWEQWHKSLDDFLKSLKDWEEENDMDKD